MLPKNNERYVRKMYSMREAILHMFTHGIPKKTFGPKKSAFGIVFAVSDPHLNVFCRPVLSIGDAVDELYYSKDSISYKAIIEGLTVARDLQIQNVDIIGDNKHVITSLRLRSNDMVCESDKHLFEACQISANKFFRYNYIDTLSKHNKAARGVAEQSLKRNKVICETFSSASDMSADNTSITLAEQYVYADFVNTFRKQ